MPKQNQSTKAKNWPKPESGGKPKRITTPGKPGDTGPGGARPARKRNASDIAKERDDQRANFWN